MNLPIAVCKRKVDLDACTDAWILMARFVLLCNFYSDKLVEQAVGMPSVAQIFKVHSEAFFRDNEVMVTEFIC